MDSPWLVSPELLAVLGQDVVDQLDSLDPLSALTCQVCGRTKPAGDPKPMAVVAARAPDGMLVVGLAHKECRDWVGDDWPAMLERIGDEDGVDALAIFAIRAGVRPRAVLAFEPSAQTRAQFPNGEGAGLHLAAHLASGFTLATVPPADITPPAATEWTLKTRGGVVALEHPEVGISYTQEITEPVRQWLKMARGEGHCLVLTGSGLNIDPAGALPQDFYFARVGGTLAAAVVRVR